MSDFKSLVVRFIVAYVRLPVLLRSLSVASKKISLPISDTEENPSIMDPSTYEREPLPTRSNIEVDSQMVSLRDRDHHVPYPASVPI